MNWDHITNWKLLPGSHDFPGPDGGTCINEAAIIAAGFEYQAINSAEDCPPCFSRVVANFAISLNDRMPHDLRQELLMPFVMRLAGTADTPEIEQSRLHLLILGICRDVLPWVLVPHRPVALTKLMMATNIREARDALVFLGEDLSMNLAVCSRVRNAVYGLDRHNDSAASWIFEATLEAATYLQGNEADAFKRSACKRSVALLDEALKIGNQSTPIDMGCVIERMEKACAPKRLETVA